MVDKEEGKGCSAMVIEKISPEESRRSWLRLKFCQVYFLLVLVAVLAFAILIFCIVFAAKLSQMNSRYESIEAKTKGLMEMKQGFNNFQNAGLLLNGNNNKQKTGDGVPSKDEYDEMEGEGLPPAIKPSKVVYGSEKDQKQTTMIPENELFLDKMKLREEAAKTVNFEKRQEDPPVINQGKYIPPTEKIRYVDPDPYRWYREGGACGKMDQCPGSKNYFFRETKPLVVISFDGFSKVYDQNRAVKNLEHIKKCGTTAEFVIPSYPTKTFPNHYTIATGVYPGHHGLVDNYVYDPAISDKVLDGKYNRDPRLFQSDPIWSLYKRVTGKKTACMMWIGCNNHPDFQPDYLEPFNFNITDAQKFDEVAEWLSKPEDERPGLTMVYIAEPDDSSHWARMNEGNLRSDALAEIDHLLGRFFNKLHDKNLMDCFNIIVLSDHGMADLYTHINLKTKLFDPKLKMITGPLARFHFDGSSTTQADIRKAFPCDNGTNHLLFNKKTFPPRCHYTENPRTGDMILEAPIGTEFRGDDSTYRHGDHGYDYLEPEMRTVFFARGPAFQRKAVLAPFQNVEYYNLFAELLDIPSKLISPNNGTYGRLEGALTKQNNEQDPFYWAAQTIPECPRRAFQLPTIKGCGPGYQSCDAPSAICHQKPRNLAATSLTDVKFCVKELCDLTVLERRETLDAPKNQFFASAVDKIVYEMATEKNSTNDCPYYREDYMEGCIFYEASPENPTTHVGLSIRNQRYMFESVKMNVFFKGVWDELNALTNEYLSNQEPLLVISGSYTKDGDLPTHLFRILLSCGPKDNWNPVLRECVDQNHSRVLSFLFPNMDEDLNCMDSRKRLLKYTARVRDIEALTGLRFFRNSLPYPQMIQRTTFIPLELW
ncbi:unnamed protein product, partial [Mesorhabditis belari]|uniref:Uncharacterized protein n=1 Tax=Mesorhabditis belari TaxID=2138241 RepID=A0AAF3FR82_9BILA